MYLEAIEITYVSPCYADPEKIRLKADLSADITLLLPYLNAVIKGASYNPGYPSLTLNKDFRVITLYARKLTIIKALNLTDAKQTIDWLKELVNNTHKRRDEIVPDAKKTEKAHPLQIFKLLPGNNCRQCKELTCMAFAARLYLNEKDLSNCLPLYAEPAYTEMREALENLLGFSG